MSELDRRGSQADLGVSLGANLAGMGLFLLIPGSVLGAVILAVGVLGLGGYQLGHPRYARRRAFATPLCALAALAALFGMVALRHQLSPWVAAPVLVLALLALSWNSLATARESWTETDPGSEAAGDSQER
jgi:hypothetical protein